MKTSLKIGGLVAAMMLAVSGASFAADPVSPYVHSSDAKIVKSAYGLCWRTGFWTPALAEAQGVGGEGCTCDADILGAHRMGWRTIFFNRKGVQVEENVATATVSSLNEIIDLL